jgi:type IV pilus assembly protein PilX
MTQRHPTLHQTGRSGQKGAVLVVSLVLLAVLTMLGVTGMMSTSLEEKMAGNTRDRNVAFQAGETGLRDAEGWIATLVNEPDPDSTASEGVYDALGLDLAAQNATWWTDASHAKTYGDDSGASALAGVATQPRYVIEYRAFVPDSFDVGFATPTGRTFYTVTARGTGAQADAGGDAITTTVLQTRYAKRFN